MLARLDRSGEILTQRDRVERDSTTRCARCSRICWSTRRSARGWHAGRGATRGDATNWVGLEPREGAGQGRQRGCSHRSLCSRMCGYACATLRRSPIFSADCRSLARRSASPAPPWSSAWQMRYLFRDPPGIANPDRLAEVGRIDSWRRRRIRRRRRFRHLLLSELSRLPRRGRRSSTGWRPITSGGSRSSGLARATNAVRGAWRVRLGQLLRRAGRADGTWTRLPARRRATGRVPVAVAVISHRLWQTQFDGSAGHRRTDGAAERPSVHDRGRRERRTSPATAIERSAPVGPDHGVPGRRRPPAVALRGRQWLMGIGRLKAGRERSSRPAPTSRASAATWSASSPTTTVAMASASRQPARCRWTAARS